MGFQQLDDFITDFLRFFQGPGILHDISFKISFSPYPSQVRKFVTVEKTLQSLDRPCTSLVCTYGYGNRFSAGQFSLVIERVTPVNEILEMPADIEIVGRGSDYQVLLRQVLCA